ncbi:hypothetical protein CB1_001109005 [Camelus ferus]|nr:hypothetical protein CB1_001109005 [Camelus ferus]
MVKSGVMVVEAEVKRVVELAPEFMEIVELEAVDSCHVDATAGASDVVTDADAVVVETAPAPAPLTVAELVVDATRAVVAAIEDRVSGHLATVLVEVDRIDEPSVGTYVVDFVVDGLDGPLDLDGPFGLDGFNHLLLEIFLVLLEQI